MSTTMKSLAELVQTLPSELYNEIYDLTFTTAASTIQIDSTYKPPSCLQVNQDTRHRAARSYYGTSIFYIHETLLRHWVASLPLEHIDLLYEIRVGEAGFHYIEFPPELTAMARLNSQVTKTLRIVRRTMPEKHGKRIDGSVLKLQVVFDDRNEGEWLSRQDTLEWWRERKGNGAAKD